MKQFFKDTFRILKITYNLKKLYFPITISKYLLQALHPFITIIFSAKILDGLTQGLDKKNILTDVYWMIALNLFFGIAWQLLGKLSSVYARSISFKMKQLITNKTHQLSYQQLESKDISDLIYDAEHGVNARGGIESFCDGICEMISYIALIFYALIIIFPLIIQNHTKYIIYPLFNPVSSVVFVFFLLATSFITNYHIVKKTAINDKLFFKKMIHSNRSFSYYANVTMNYAIHKDIRIYGLKKIISKNLNRYSSIFCNTMIENGKFHAKKTAISIIINSIVIYLAYIFIGTKALLGMISIGSVLKCLNAFNAINMNLNNLFMYYHFSITQINYLKLYTDFMDINNDMYQGTLPLEKRDDNEYKLEFRNVSFHYPNSNEYILKNISLTLKIGQKMAIVGPNGAGKTTFIKLLCRLYDPSDGEILLNGIDIRKYDYQEYLNLFSVVFQDFKLFSLGIAENVSCDKSYDVKKVWETLTQAGIDNRIKQMENDILTQLYQDEKNGIEISGGEAQKIAIARALYRNAPIVILDEPTSALDPISEYEIYHKFNKLTNNKTSIFISHRMSSCRFCNNIIVFNDGKITQKGSHDKLMNEKNGLYFQLWNSQAKYYN